MHDVEQYRDVYLRICKACMAKWSDTCRQSPRFAGRLPLRKRRRAKRKLLPLLRGRRAFGRKPAIMRFVRPIQLRGRRRHFGILASLRRNHGADQSTEWTARKSKPHSLQHREDPRQFLQFQHAASIPASDLHFLRHNQGQQFGPVLGRHAQLQQYQFRYKWSSSKSNQPYDTCVDLGHGLRHGGWTWFGQCDEPRRRLAHGYLSA